jgi:hypothetical protein
LPVGHVGGGARGVYRQVSVSRGTWDEQEKQDQSRSNEAGKICPGM